MQNRYTMKKLVTPVLFLAFTQFPSRSFYPQAPGTAIVPAHNLIIVTLDGFRWQEVFNGADSAIISNETYTPDTSTMKMMYWAPTAEERRKKLMPFFWNVLGVKGQVWGNRQLENKVNVANDYAISYPGYSEMFTGFADPTVSSNRKHNNPNCSVLEHLVAKAEFHNRVAVFTSWDVFPYIFNTRRSDLFINSGYASVSTGDTPSQVLFNKVQEEIFDKKATRHDQLTFIAAKEYLQKNRPRVLFLGLGETDEAAHDKRYDIYLEKANQADKMLAEIWHWVQSTAGYKNNTTLIITTDHGRGNKTATWTSHGSFIRGSSQTWLAMIGPHINAAGEIKGNEQLYQAQLAQTMAHLVGEEFIPSHETAPAITLR